MIDLKVGDLVMFNYDEVRRIYEYGKGPHRIIKTIEPKSAYGHFLIYLDVDEGREGHFKYRLLKVPEKEYTLEELL